MSPRFLETLKPPRWAEVARQGCFVYCYLRRTDGTPYYIGLAVRASRPIKKTHKYAPVPPKGERHRIRVLRSGLTREEAAEWEKFYISRYGREDLGTGRLLNRTAGGDGMAIPSPEHRAKLARLVRERMTGRKFPGRPGHPHTEEHKRYMSELMMGRVVTPEWRQRISESRKGRTFPKSREAHLRRSAEKQGVPYEDYAKLTPQQRSNMRCWRSVNPGRPAIEYLRERGWTETDEPR